MPRAYVSIGSNVERESHISSAVSRLDEAFGGLVLSTVYETAAVGFEGPPFYNLAAGFDTDLLPDELHEFLRGVEDELGRDRTAPSFSDRSIDLDLLLYDDLVLKSAAVTLPRQDIERFAFVLCPLAEIAPDLRHPISGKTLSEMWQVMKVEIADKGVDLTPVDPKCVVMPTG